MCCEGGFGGYGASPHSSLKSVMARIALQMIGRCRRASGITWSRPYSQVMVEIE